MAIRIYKGVRVGPGADPSHQTNLELCPSLKAKSCQHTQGNSSYRSLSFPIPIPRRTPAPSSPLQTSTSTSTHALFAQTSKVSHLQRRTSQNKLKAYSNLRPDRQQPCTRHRWLDWLASPLCPRINRRRESELLVTKRENFSISSSAARLSFSVPRSSFLSSLLRRLSSAATLLSTTLVYDALLARRGIERLQHRKARPLCC